MPEPEDWRVADRAYLRGILTGWAPGTIPAATPSAPGAGEPAASGGWVGIVQENTPLVPNPAPSGKREAPTLFAVWRLEWPRTVGCYGTEGEAPERHGKLTIAIFTEIGAQGGFLEAVAKALLHTLDDASDQPDARIYFDAQEAALVTAGDRGSWFIANLFVPATG